MKFDEYVYPGTKILKNKLNIMDAQLLIDAERATTFKNMMKLRARGVTGKFNVQHLQNTHKELFGDIYDWAGKFREIDIWKGGTEFAPFGEIPERLNQLYGHIRSQNYFRGLPEKDTAWKLADVMGTLNYIHPFREGNGRTQRLFIEQLAMNAGYDLDLTKISENDMRDASRTAARGDMRFMRYLIADSMHYTGEMGPVRELSKREQLVQRALSFLSLHDEDDFQFE